MHGQWSRFSYGNNGHYKNIRRRASNFLDVGAASNTVKNGFKIILSDKNVKAILINIFRCIVRCDRVANGVVEAVKELGLDVPVVVRLEGTNSKRLKKY